MALLQALDALHELVSVPLSGGAASAVPGAELPGAALDVERLGLEGPTMARSEGRVGVRAGGPGPSPPKGTIGVFLTPQSLVTFPVASGALMVVWKVLTVVFSSWGASKFVPFIGAFLLGMFIYYISLPENASRRLRTIGAGIGVINSFSSRRRPSG